MSDNRTVATLFAGFGLKTIGAIQAGYTPVFSCEWNGNKMIGGPDAIAQVYAKNLGSHALHCTPVQDITDLVWRSLDGVGLLMMSPPCTMYSVANARGGGERDLDMEMAEASCRAIRLTRPERVVVENVEGYRKSGAFKLITDTLNGLGYWWDARVINAADYGVPQTRRRLILRASRLQGWFLPIRLTHDKQGAKAPGGDLLPWNGWYDAIGDLLPGLQDTDLAPWQKKRLLASDKTPDWLRSVLVGGLPGGSFADGGLPPVMQGEGSSPCITGSSYKHPLRAVIVNSGNGSQEILTLRDGTEPASTLLSNQGRAPFRAVIVGNGGRRGEIATYPEPGPAGSVTANTNQKTLRAVLVESKNANQERGDGAGHLPEPATTVVRYDRPAHVPIAATEARIVRLDARCLARFQTLPDWYALSGKASLDSTGIGNGLPCRMAEAIVRSLDG